MGDEMHNRNKASNSLSTLALTPHIIAAANSADQAIKALTFIEGSGHFILNSVMPSCKAMLDAGAASRIPPSSPPLPETALRSGSV